MNDGVAPAEGVLLIGHGTVEDLDDLPEFLANIRRGHPAPPDLLAEVRRRYEAIGGRSPLLAITRELAVAVEAAVKLPVAVGMRLFHPLPAQALRALVGRGVRDVVVVPLAQHSAHVYAEAVRAAAADVAEIGSVRSAPNWGRHPLLTQAFAAEVARTLASVNGDPAATALVLTAHSLPRAVIDAGDPYEREFRGSAADVVAALDPTARARFAEHVVAFQSQGMSAGPGGRPMPWLGPDLRATLEELHQRGRRHVVFAPLGFLADHVEILYDLDVEARGWAREMGIETYRTASLNSGHGLVAAILAVVEEVRAAGARPRAAAESGGV